MISYAHEGGGVPVVCLHGWPGAASDYRALLPLLERDAQVVVPELLGFGASFLAGDELRPASDFGRDAQAAAVLELMDHLGFEDAVLVGYDVGSTTASHLARTRPERVRALVLGNAVHPGSAGAALDDDHRAAPGVDEQVGVRAGPQPAVHVALVGRPRVDCDRRQHPRHRARGGDGAVLAAGPARAPG